MQLREIDPARMLQILKHRDNLTVNPRQADTIQPREIYRYIDIRCINFGANLLLVECHECKGVSGVFHISKRLSEG
jgi:hypothetical protein